MALKGLKYPVHEPVYTQAKGKVLVQCDCGSSLGKHESWMDAQLAVIAHKHEVRHDA